MKVTEKGQGILNAAVHGVLRAAHLFDESGAEMTGHGYEPITLDPGKWDHISGLYRGAVWVFEAGETTSVAGYYLTDASGTIVLMEDLPEAFEVTHKGSRLEIDLLYTLNRGASEMRPQ